MVSLAFRAESPRVPAQVCLDRVLRKRFRFMQIRYSDVC